mmetsp:Transcript_19194/g.60363  ORF Transcript_19194/g.60363 Transcript_19194/m.60363 type:complete len:209 (-) Transcript_19194:420-1046(-)
MEYLYAFQRASPAVCWTRRSLSASLAACEACMRTVGSSRARRAASAKVSASMARASSRSRRRSASLVAASRVRSSSSRSTPRATTARRAESRAKARLARLASLSTTSSSCARSTTTCLRRFRTTTRASASSTILTTRSTAASLVEPRPRTSRASCVAASATLSSWRISCASDLPTISALFWIDSCCIVSEVSSAASSDIRFLIRSRST